MILAYLIAMHALCATSFLVAVAILLKTKWWRYDVAINALLFAAGMAVITFSILLQYYKLITDPHLYAMILTTQLAFFALLYLWRFVAILYYNWRYWAWSDDDSFSS